MGLRSYLSWNLDKATLPELHFSFPYSFCRNDLEIWGQYFGRVLVFQPYLWTDNYVCVCVSHSVVSTCLRPHGLEPTRLLYPWNSPGKNTGVGCHSLLQGIFLTQEGIEPGSPALQADSLPSETQGSEYHYSSLIYLKNDDVYLILWEGS